MTSKGLLTAVLALAGSLLLAVSALAQTPTNDIYSPIRHRTITHDPSAASLPFTGFELVVLIVAALIVIATGLLLRRASRSN